MKLWCQSSSTKFAKKLAVWMGERNFHFDTVFENRISLSMYIMRYCCRYTETSVESVWPREIFVSRTLSKLPLSETISPGNIFCRRHLCRKNQVHERFGHERSVQERSGHERSGHERSGHERSDHERSVQERFVQEKSDQEKYMQSKHENWSHKDFGQRAPS